MLQSLIPAVLGRRNRPDRIGSVAVRGQCLVVRDAGARPVRKPPARDVARFDAAWQGLVVSGRVLSLAMAGAFAGVLAALFRRLAGSWQIGIFAGIALGLSSGLALHFRMIRTELLSSGFAMSVLLLMLVVTWEKSARWRSAWPPSFQCCPCSPGAWPAWGRPRSPIAHSAHIFPAFINGSLRCFCWQRWGFMPFCGV